MTKTVAQMSQSRSHTWLKFSLLSVSVFLEMRTLAGRTNAPVPSSNLPGNTQKGDVCAELRRWATLLFPGYRSERAIVIFMRCEVGTFAAAGRGSSVRTHASARLTSAARAGQRVLPADGL